MEDGHRRSKCLADSKSELSEMNLVKYDFVRMADAPESCQEGQNRNDHEADFVVHLAPCRFLHMLLRGGQCLP